MQSHSKCTHLVAASRSRVVRYIDMAIEAYHKLELTAFA